MQKKSGVREGSDGVGAGRDGVDKWRGSWRETRDARAAEAAMPKHWAASRPASSHSLTRQWGCYSLSMSGPIRRIRPFRSTATATWKPSATSILRLARELLQEGMHGDHHGVTTKGEHLALSCDSLHQTKCAKREREREPTYHCECAMW